MYIINKGKKQQTYLRVLRGEILWNDIHVRFSNKKVERRHEQEGKNKNSITHIKGETHLHVAHVVVVPDTEL